MLELTLLNLILVADEIPTGCEYTCSELECPDGPGTSVGYGHFLP